MIPDQDAEMPEDWDEEDDGEWEPPMMPNPEFKGEWRQKMMDNPNYKGPWEHPMIPNPDFVDDDTVYHVCNKGCQFVGFELWQVKSGTIFDDILVTDDVAVAEKAVEAFKAKAQAMKEMEDAEKKKEEEERKAAEAAAEEDEDEEENVEHEEL